MSDLTWIDISKQALSSNIEKFRDLIGDDVILCPCVKSNAYGHGLIETAKTFLKAGADWLAVNAIYEAEQLRNAGINCPIYTMGYIAIEDLKKAVELDIRMVVYNLETIKRLGEIGKKTKIHIKVETGNNRQGVLLQDLVEFANLVKSFGNIEIEGIATHFANIEDTTDHSYAEEQLNKFEDAINVLEKAGFNIPIKHCANSAATILFKKTYFNLVRTGISNYGMWPSNETYVSYLKELGSSFDLKPAFTWKTKIAQIKKVKAGEYIGYGCTYKTSHESKIAILPIGYYDGYDRGINGAHVLIHGKRAAIRGRICMNIIMVDISDIPEAELEDEVTLIGRDGEEEISAEQFARWVGTINYEVTTRVNDRIKRNLI